MRATGCREAAYLNERYVGAKNKFCLTNKKDACASFLFFSLAVYWGGCSVAGKAAFIDRRTRPLSSVSITLTFTTWPSLR